MKIFQRSDLPVFKKGLLALFIFLLGASVASAVVKTSAGSGPWATPGTWSPSGVPALGDDVVIANTHTVTVGAHVSAALPATVTVNQGGTLSVGGFNFTVMSTTTVSGTLEHTGTGGTHTFTGDVTIASSGVWNETADVAPAFYGHLNNDGTLTAANGVHTFAGAAKTFGGAHEIAIPKTAVTGTYTNNGTLTVNTALSGVGGLTQGGGSLLKIGGPTTTAITITTLNATSNVNTVNYTGAIQTVKGTGYVNLTLSGSGAKTLNSVTVNGILTMEGTAIGAGTIAYGSAATLLYNSDTAHTVGTEWLSPFSASGGIVISNTGAIAIAAGKTINATSLLMIRSGATFKDDGGGRNLIVNGDFLNESENPLGGLITFYIAGTAADQRIDGFTSAGTVVMSKTAGMATFMGNVNAGLLTTSGSDSTLHLGSGLVHTFNGWTRSGVCTVNGGSSTFRITGNFSTSSTSTLLAAGTGTVELSGSVAQTAGAYTYNNLVFSGIGVKTIASEVVITGNFSISGSATSSLPAGVSTPCGSLTLGGIGRNSGTWGSTTATSATYQTNLFFSATTGYLTVNTDTRTLTPTVSSWPTAAGSIIYGQPLSAAGLSGGSASVPGQFVFVSPATVPDVGTVDRPIQFVPTDVGAYFMVSGTASVTVNPRVVSLAGRRPYDGTAVAAASILKVVNKVGADTVMVASGSATLASAGDPSVAHAYAISSLGDLALGNNALGNYTLAGASGAVAIVNAGAADALWTTTGGTNDWFNSANWRDGFLPYEDSDVLITNKSTGVLLTNSSPNLKSLTLASTLVFSNWNTSLSASNVLIQANGVVTLPPAFTTAEMSNRVWFVCENFTLSSNAVINADGCGYYTGYGPGAVSGQYGCGAGHGGRGGLGNNGSAAGGQTYGESNAPTTPGSGGGFSSAGNGGGVVRIQASETNTIFGVISANGIKGTVSGGGGSGGSIYLSCKILAGTTNGLLSVKGGDAVNSGSPGGGGRIAVIYNESGQAGINPGVRFSAGHGVGGFSEEDPSLNAELCAQDGTLFLTDRAFVTELIKDQLFNGVRLFVPGFTSWAPNNLTLSNKCVLTFGPVGFQLTVTNNILITTDSGLGLDIPNGELNCNSLTLTNTGSLWIYSGPTNASVDYGALVSVTNDVLIGANSWIFPNSSSTNGGSVLFRLNTLTINAGGGFNASGKGFAKGKGAGAGFNTSPYTGSGAAYGGKGGDGFKIGVTTPGANVCGTTNAPIDPGSGGGTVGVALGGSGGGLIRIQASGTVTINGSLKANGRRGASPSGGYTGGGGAGGGIFVNCSRYSGSGAMQANGGTSATPGGGGGGGRIAVWSGVPQARMDQYLATENVKGVVKSATLSGYDGSSLTAFGTGYTNLPPGGAESGTQWFFTWKPGGGSLILIR